MKTLLLLINLSCFAGEHMYDRAAMKLGTTRERIEQVALMRTVNHDRISQVAYSEAERAATIASGEYGWPVKCKQNPTPVEVLILKDINTKIELDLSSALKFNRVNVGLYYGSLCLSGLIGYLLGANSGY